MKSYPAYIPSGIEWVGDVPAHWEHRKLRSILHRTNERDRHDLPLLSVVRERGVIPRDVTYSDDNHNVIPENLSNYKVVHTGQLAMNKMKAWQGSYGVSEHTGIVSPAYFTFDIEGVTGEFLHVALRSKAYVPFFTAASDGVRIAQWDLSPTQMREIPLWIPPLPEQRAIARYLDYMDRRIQRYIRAKERLIELLEEQKRAVINQAVTRGLDPDVRLKASGVEWLGDVPAHWEQRQLRTVTKIFNGATPSTNVAGFWDGDIVWVTPDDLGKLSDRYVTNSGRRITAEGYASCGTSLAPAGSIALSTRAPIGHLGILMIDACVNQGCRLLAPKSFIDTEFLYLVLLAARGELSSLGQGSTFTELSRGRLASFKLPVPPLEEQTTIVDHVTCASSRIDSQIANCRRQIELIAEYRARLVSDVVTGKLDVRDAAEGLADELGDDELLDRFELAEVG